MLTASFCRYFTFLTQCKTPKACTILLRGPSKDILNEIDRNLADAMSVARNVFFNPVLAPGGGATEMAMYVLAPFLRSRLLELLLTRFLSRSVGLHNKARSITGVEGWPFRAVADAMEVIPRTLAQNAGGNAIRVLTELRVRVAGSYLRARIAGADRGHRRAGEARERRALVGHQRRDGQDCGHEDVRAVRVREREDTDAENCHRGAFRIPCLFPTCSQTAHNVIYRRPVCCCGWTTSSKPNGKIGKVEAVEVEELRLRMRWRKAEVDRCCRDRL